MLAWIKKNKDWLFSGVAVAVIGAVISHFWPDGDDLPPQPPDHSVHQTHNGTGDTVAGDKNVTNDNSIHQTNRGGGDNVAGNKNVYNAISRSVEYQQLEQELKDAIEEILKLNPKSSNIPLWLISNMKSTYS